MNNLFGNFFGTNDRRSSSNNLFGSTNLFENIGFSDPFGSNDSESNNDEPRTNDLFSDPHSSTNFMTGNPFSNSGLFQRDPFSIGDDIFQDAQGAFHDLSSNINFKPELNESTLSNLDIKQCDKCSICLENFEIGEKACITSCGHIYHKECLEPWLKNIKKYNCPVCKKDFTTDSINKEAIDRWKNTANEQNQLGAKSDSIKNMSVKTLKKILIDHGYDLKGIIEKSELIGMVHDLLYKKLSIIDIKKILDKRKISYKGCLEKSEFIRLLEVALLYDKK